MNILPKKRFHVKTKENVARVNQDVQKFKEEQDLKTKKIRLADQESRTDLLRSRKCQSTGNTLVYHDLRLSIESSNREFEEESRADKEKFDKHFFHHNKFADKVNIESWWMKTRTKDNKQARSSDNQTLDPDLTRKLAKDEARKKTEDPLYKIEKHRCETTQSEITSSSSSHSHKYENLSIRLPNDIKAPLSNKIVSSNIKKLREERLKREVQERERIAALLAKKI